MAKKHLELQSSDLEYEVVSYTQSYSGATGPIGATVQAPVGKVVVGGGVSTTGGSDFRVLGSFPVLVSGKATGWEARGIQPTDIGPFSVTAWAICIRE